VSSEPDSVLYVDAVTIEPESKSWMWVLEKQCEECGFDTRSFPAREIAGLSRAAGEPWPSLLANPLVRLRPRDDRWSALEYGCHVRDAFRLGCYRVQRMLQEDEPKFVNWDQDATAVSDHYELQDPLVVAADIVEAADAFADIYDTVSADQWDRTGLRSDGSLFTVESFGRYFVHDPMHHIIDVQRGYEELHKSR
jgi:hypothetical protein